jgi:hypothetical protein
MTQPRAHRVREPQRQRCEWPRVWIGDVGVEIRDENPGLMRVRLPPDPLPDLSPAIQPVACCHWFFTSPRRRSGGGGVLLTGEKSDVESR